MFLINTLALAEQWRDGQRRGGALFVDADASRGTSGPGLLDVERRGATVAALDALLAELELAWTAMDADHGLTLDLDDVDRSFPPDQPAGLGMVWVPTGSGEWTTMALTTVAGWLIGYPVVYCLQSADDNCLGHVDLVRTRVTVALDREVLAVVDGVDSGGSGGGGSGVWQALEAASAPSTTLMSFTCPAALEPEASDAAVGASLEVIEAAAAAAKSSLGLTVEVVTERWSEAKILL